MLNTSGKYFGFALMLGFFLHSLLPSLHAQGKKDAWLKKMAPIMKPTPFSKSSLGKVQKQMLQAISVIERADQSDGPKPNELITRACEKHPAHGPIRTMITANIVEQAYEDAMYLGLFNDKGKFNSLIKNGPNVGKKIQFEYIVPPEKAPEFSQDIANIRIVLASQKRQQTSLNPRDEAHLEKLTEMKRETLNLLQLHESESGHMLDTSYSTPDKGPHYKKWEASMEVAGEAAHQPAEINLEARKQSSASSSNGEKMAVWVRLNNLIKTPTQVNVHCYMLGRTERKRVLFKIGHSQKEVVLLPHDSQQMLLYSRAFPSLKNHVADLDMLQKKERKKARFFVRGWVVRVEHKGKVVAAEASMSSLLPYADEKFKELNNLP